MSAPTVAAVTAASTWELNAALTSRERREASPAREAVRQAVEAQRSAAAQSREVARQLRELGLSGRDIAALLQLSPQRMSQLLLQSKPRGGKAAVASSS